MQVSEAKKLKVGDKVKIKQGSCTYGYYVPEMDQAVGMIVTIDREYEICDNDIFAVLPSKIENYCGLYFSPSWIECKVEESEEPAKVIDSAATSKQHPKAEVLRWIADGEEVEGFHDADRSWYELDTSGTFSISREIEYRKAEKKFQILCKDNFTGKYFVAKGLFLKEEAVLRDDFVQVLE